MKPEVEFSLWNRGDRSIQQLRQLIANFSTSANLTPYTDAWAEVANAMLYHHGPDISEVGSTWVESLAATDALTRITPASLDTLGGLAAFVSTTRENPENGIFSVPFQAETRMVFYRRDLLANAGIDEGTAFSTPQHFLATLDTLSLAGNRYPLLVNVNDRWLNLSFAASWIWGAGGDFIDVERNRVVFDGEAALRGLNDYYLCARYLPPDMPKIHDLTEFVRGAHAVMLGGPWTHNYLHHETVISSHFLENVGIAPLPGIPYKGGTNLVIWKHSRKAEAAKSLLKDLCSKSFQAQWVSGILPARRDVLESANYQNNPFYSQMSKTILQGRSYPTVRLWGVVENRLSRALEEIWGECLQNPFRPPVEILEAQLKPLARRINLSLEG